MADLGILTLQIGADLSDLESALLQAESIARDSAAKIAKIAEQGFKFHVNDDELTFLSHTLDALQPELTQAIDFFDDRFITPRTQLGNLDQLEASLQRIAALEKQISQDLAISTETRNTVSPTLKPIVDDSELTRLNEHLDLKQKHLLETVNFFKKTPIKVGTIENENTIQSPNKKKTLTLKRPVGRPGQQPKEPAPARQAKASKEQPSEFLGMQEKQLTSTIDSGLKRGLNESKKTFKQILSNPFSLNTLVSTVTLPLRMVEKTIDSIATKFANLHFKQIFSVPLAKKIIDEYGTPKKATKQTDDIKNIKKVTAETNQAFVAVKHLNQEFINPKVNDQELTKLNKHLELKRKHLEETISFFASHPIEVRTQHKDGAMGYQESQGASSTPSSQQQGRGTGILGAVEAPFKALLAPVKLARTALSNVMGNVMVGALQEIGGNVSRKFSGGLSRQIETSLAPLVGSTEYLGEILVSKPVKSVQAKVQRASELLEQLYPETHQQLKEHLEERQKQLKESLGEEGYTIAKLSTQGEERGRVKTIGATATKEFTVQTEEFTEKQKQVALEEAKKHKQISGYQADVEEIAQAASPIMARLQASSEAKLSGDASQVLLENEEAHLQEQLTELRKLGSRKRQLIIDAGKELEASQAAAKAQVESFKEQAEVLPKEPIAPPPPKRYKPPSVYKQILSSVVARSNYQGEVFIPRLLVDPEMGKSGGALASYRHQTNEVAISPQAAKEIQSGNVTRMTVEVLVHELRHAIQSGFGERPLSAPAIPLKDVTPEQAQRLGRVIEGSVEVGTTTSGKEVSPEGKAYIRRNEKDAYRFQEEESPEIYREVMLGKAESSSGVGGAKLKSKLSGLVDSFINIDVSEASPQLQELSGTIKEKILKLNVVLETHAERIANTVNLTIEEIEASIAKTRNIEQVFSSVAKAVTSLDEAVKTEAETKVSKQKIAQAKEEARAKIQIPVETPSISIKAPELGKISEPTGTAKISRKLEVLRSPLPGDRNKTMPSASIELEIGRRATKQKLTAADVLSRKGESAIKSGQHDIAADLFSRSQERLAEAEATMKLLIDRGLESRLQGGLQKQATTVRFNAKERESTWQKPSPTLVSAIPKAEDILSDLWNLPTIEKPSMSPKGLSAMQRLAKRIAGGNKGGTGESGFFNPGVVLDMVGEAISAPINWGKGLFNKSKPITQSQLIQPQQYIAVSSGGLPSGISGSGSQNNSLFSGGLGQQPLSASQTTQVFTPNPSQPPPHPRPPNPGTRIGAEHPFIASFNQGQAGIRAQISSMETEMENGIPARLKQFFDKLIANLAGYKNIIEEVQPLINQQLDKSEALIGTGKVKQGLQLQGRAQSAQSTLAEYQGALASGDLGGIAKTARIKELQSKLKGFRNEVEPQSFNIARAYRRISGALNPKNRAESHKEFIARQSYHLLSDLDPILEGAKKEAADPTSGLSPELSASRLERLAHVEAAGNKSRRLGAKTDLTKGEVQELEQANRLIKDFYLAMGHPVPTEFMEIPTAIERIKASMDGAIGGAKELLYGFASFMAVNAVFGVVLGSFEGIKNVLKESIQLTKELDTAQKSLYLADDTLSIHSTRGTVEQLKDNANKEGYSYKDALNRKVEFQGATLGTSINGARGNELLNTAESAFTSLHTGSAQASSVIQSFAQSASTGTVTGEQLRQELGQNIPGALAVMARSLGTSTVQLNKFLSEGELAANQVLPAFAEQLKLDSSNEFNSAITENEKSINRLSNTLTEAKEKLGSIFTPAIGAGASGLNSTIGFITANIDKFAAALAVLATLQISRILEGFTRLVGLLGSAVGVLGGIAAKTGALEALVLVFGKLVQVVASFVLPRSFMEFLLLLGAATATTIFEIINHKSAFTDLADGIDKSSESFYKLKDAIKGAGEEMKNIDTTKAPGLFGLTLPDKDKTPVNLDIVRGGLQSAQRWFFKQTHGGSDEGFEEAPGRVATYSELLTNKATVDKNQIRFRGNQSIGEAISLLGQTGRFQSLENIDQDLAATRARKATLTSADKGELEQLQQREEELTKKRVDTVKPVLQTQELLLSAKDAAEGAANATGNIDEKVGFKNLAGEIERYIQRLNDLIRLNQDQLSQLHKNYVILSQSSSAYKEFLDRERLKGEGAVYRTSSVGFLTQATTESLSHYNETSTLKRQIQQDQRDLTQVEKLLSTPESSSILDALKLGRPKDLMRMSDEQVGYVEQLNPNNAQVKDVMGLTKLYRGLTNRVSTNQVQVERIDNTYGTQLQTLSRSLTAWLEQLKNQIIDLQRSILKTTTEMAKTITETRMEIESSNVSARMQQLKNKLMTSYNGFLDALGLGTGDLIQTFFEGLTSILDRLGSVFKLKQDAAKIPLESEARQFELQEEAKTINITRWRETWKQKHDFEEQRQSIPGVTTPETTYTPNEYQGGSYPEVVSPSAGRLAMPAAPPQPTKQPLTIPKQPTAHPTNIYLPSMTSRNSLLLNSTMQGIQTIKPQSTKTHPDPSIAHPLGQGIMGGLRYIAPEYDVPPLTKPATHKKGLLKASIQSDPGILLASGATSDMGVDYGIQTREGEEIKPVKGFDPPTISNEAAPKGLALFPGHFNSFNSGRDTGASHGSDIILPRGFNTAHREGDTARNATLEQAGNLMSVTSDGLLTSNIDNQEGLNSLASLAQSRQISQGREPGMAQRRYELPGGYAILNQPSDAAGEMQLTSPVQLPQLTRVPSTQYNLHSQLANPQHSIFNDPGVTVASVAISDMANFGIKPREIKDLPQQKLIAQAVSGQRIEPVEGEFNPPDIGEQSHPKGIALFTGHFNNYYKDGYGTGTSTGADFKSGRPVTMPSRWNFQHPARGKDDGGTRRGATLEQAANLMNNAVFQNLAKPLGIKTIIAPNETVDLPMEKYGQRIQKAASRGWLPFEFHMVGGEKEDPTAGGGFFPNTGLGKKLNNYIGHYGWIDEIKDGQRQYGELGSGYFMPQHGGMLFEVGKTSKTERAIRRYWAATSDEERQAALETYQGIVAPGMMKAIEGLHRAGVPMNEDKLREFASRYGIMDKSNEIAHLGSTSEGNIDQPPSQISFNQPIRQEASSLNDPNKPIPEFISQQVGAGARDIAAKTPVPTILPRVPVVQQPSSAIRLNDVPTPPPQVKQPRTTSSSIQATGVGHVAPYYVRSVGRWIPGLHQIKRIHNLSEAYAHHPGGYIERGGEQYTDRGLVKDIILSRPDDIENLDVQQRALQSGRVSFAGVRGGYGYAVIIQGDNGGTTLQAHMKRGSLLVKAGDRVQFGQPVGMQGGTAQGGETLDAQHSHFEGPAPILARAIKAYDTGDFSSGGDDSQNIASQPDVDEPQVQIPKSNQTYTPKNFTESKGDSDNPSNLDNLNSIPALQPIKTSTRNNQRVEPPSSSTINVPVQIQPPQETAQLFLQPSQPQPRIVVPPTTRGITQTAQRRIPMIGGYMVVDEPTTVSGESTVVPRQQLPAQVSPQPTIQVPTQRVIQQPQATRTNRRRGVMVSASFYGADDHGNINYGGEEGGTQTASGRDYLGRRVGAAHQFDATKQSFAMPNAGQRGALPFGTIARFTNPKTGVSTEAMLTDTGPFENVDPGARGRGVDMSYALSHAIGFPGTGDVEIEPVYIPGATPGQRYTDRTSSGSRSYEFTAPEQNIARAPDFSRTTRQASSKDVALAPTVQPLSQPNQPNQPTAHAAPKPTPRIQPITVPVTVAPPTLQASQPATITKPSSALQITPVSLDLPRAGDTISHLLPISQESQAIPITPTKLIVALPQQPQIPKLVVAPPPKPTPKPIIKRSTVAIYGHSLLDLNPYSLNPAANYFPFSKPGGYLSDYSPITTAKGQPRFPGLQADRSIIAAPTNDLLATIKQSRTGHFLASQMRALAENYVGTIQKTLETTTGKIAPTEIPFINNNQLNTHAEAFNSQVEGMLKPLQQQYGSRLQPLLRFGLTPKDFPAGSQIHPGESGYRKIRDAIEQSSGIPTTYPQGEAVYYPDHKKAAEQTKNYIQQTFGAGLGGDYLASRNLPNTKPPILIAKPTPSPITSKESQIPMSSAAATNLFQARSSRPQIQPGIEGLISQAPAILATLTQPTPLSHRFPEEALPIPITAPTIPVAPKKFRLHPGILGLLAEKPSILTTLAQSAPLKPKPVPIPSATPKLPSLPITVVPTPVQPKLLDMMPGISGFIGSVLPIGRELVNRRAAQQALLKPTPPIQLPQIPVQSQASRIVEKVAGLEAARLAFNKIHTEALRQAILPTAQLISPSLASKPLNTTLIQPGNLKEIEANLAIQLERARLEQQKPVVVPPTIQVPAQEVPPPAPIPESPTIQAPPLPIAPPPVQQPEPESSKPTGTLGTTVLPDFDLKPKIEVPVAAPIDATVPPPASRINIQMPDIPAPPAPSFLYKPPATPNIGAGAHSTKRQPPATIKKPVKFKKGEKNDSSDLPLQETTNESQPRMILASTLNFGDSSSEGNQPPTDIQQPPNLLQTNQSATKPSLMQNPGGLEVDTNAIPLIRSQDLDEQEQIEKQQQQQLQQLERQQLQPPAAIQQPTVIPTLSPGALMQGVNPIVVPPDNPALAPIVPSPLIHQPDAYEYPGKEVMAGFTNRPGFTAAINNAGKQGGFPAGTIFLITNPVTRQSVKVRLTGLGEPMTDKTMSISIGATRAIGATHLQQPLMVNPVYIPEAAPGQHFAMAPYKGAPVNFQASATAASNINRDLSLGYASPGVAAGLNSDQIIPQLQGKVLDTFQQGQQRGRQLEGVYASQVEKINPLITTQIRQQQELGMAKTEDNTAQQDAEMISIRRTLTETQNTLSRQFREHDYQIKGYGIQAQDLSLGSAYQTDKNPPTMTKQLYSEFHIDNLGTMMNNVNESIKEFNGQINGYINSYTQLRDNVTDNLKAMQAEKEQFDKTPEILAHAAEQATKDAESYRKLALGYREKQAAFKQAGDETAATNAGQQAQIYENNAKDALKYKEQIELATPALTGLAQQSSARIAPQIEKLSAIKLPSAGMGVMDMLANPTIDALKKFEDLRVEAVPMNFDKKAQETIRQTIDKFDKAEEIFKALTTAYDKAISQLQTELQDPTLTEDQRKSREMSLSAATAKRDQVAGIAQGMKPLAAQAVDRQQFNTYQEEHDKALDLKANRFDREGGPIFGAFEADNFRRQAALDRLTRENQTNPMSTEVYNEKLSDIMSSTQTLRKILQPVQEGFANLFTSLVNGSTTAGNAFRTFAKGVVDSMLGLVSQDLSKRLFNSLFKKQLGSPQGLALNSFGGPKDQPGAVAPYQPSEDYMGGGMFEKGLGGQFLTSQAKLLGGIGRTRSQGLKFTQSEEPLPGFTGGFSEPVKAIASNIGNDLSYQNALGLTQSNLPSFGWASQQSTQSLNSVTSLFSKNPLSFGANPLPLMNSQSAGLGGLLSIFSGLGGGGRSMLPAPSSGLGAGLGGISQLFSLFGGGSGGAALGGILLPQMTSQPAGMGGLFSLLAPWVPKFASGGVVDSPTVAQIGEGGFNEAVVPLPNGRSIPVQMSGGGNNFSQGDTNHNVAIHVNVHNGSEQNTMSEGQVNEFSKRMKSSVVEVLLAEQRPGGSLYGARQ